MNDNEKIVTLRSYADPVLAEIHRGILETNGISCFTADNTAYKLVLGGVELKVFEHDLQKCLAILADTDHSNDLPSA